MRNLLKAVAIIFAFTAISCSNNSKIENYVGNWLPPYSDTTQDDTRPISTFKKLGDNLIYQSTDLFSRTYELPAEYDQQHNIVTVKWEGGKKTFYYSIDSAIMKENFNGATYNLTKLTENEVEDRNKKLRILDSIVKYEISHEIFKKKHYNL